MKEWSLFELLKFRAEAMIRLDEFKNGTKWYDSRKVKSIRAKVQEAIESEINKVESEINSRVGYNNFWK